MLKTKNYVYGLFFVILITVAVYSLLFKESKNLVLVQSSAVVGTSTIDHSDLSVTASSAPVANKIVGLIPGTSAWTVMLNDFKQWSEDHGYPSAEKNSDYNQYEESTLKSLAEGGDLKAMMLLGDNAIKNNDTEKAEHYFEIAALRGSTFAIDRLSILSAPKQFSGYAPEAEKNQSFYETMAYAAVAEMRGDTFLANSRRNSLIENEKLNFNSDDYDHIDTRAKEIYNDFQARRIQLGLGDFDNTAPTPYR
ncbi:MAG: hypothetical protein V4732_06510 [Pseudomonadota bacterium]